MGNTLIQFRKALHQNPELSGQEIKTSGRIVDFLRKYQPNKIIRNLGGHGVAAVFEFSTDGPTVMIRCELDALPICEKNAFSHKSTVPNVSHKCGHDGHMTILCGLAQKLQSAHFKKGKVILLFQPAEETGQGARAVLEDPKFKEILPEYIFALHNLPGLPMHSVFWVKGQFTPTVQSLAVKLFGKSAHAAEPENGINPALAMSEIIRAFQKLEIPDSEKRDFALITPVHMTLGEKNYGISAGAGELHFTLRCWTTHRMEKLVADCFEILKAVCAGHHLTYETAWFDYFPTVLNDDFCNECILKATKANDLELITPPNGCKFGEDFGFFTQQIPGAMFGLGAGENTPALHHDDYDFPDELIDTGIDMFWEIIKSVINRI